METIMELIIEIIIGFGIIFACRKQYKKENNNIYRMFYFVVGTSYFILVLIYNLDRYNIPTKFGWIENINSQNWLAFLSTYISSIASAIIGALFLIAVTVKQLEYTSKDSEKREQENLRIQNLPILKYSFDSENKLLGEGDRIITNAEGEDAYSFNLHLKNVGLNTIKSLKIDFKSDLINNSMERMLGKEDLEIMEKGEEKEVNKFFNLTYSDVPYKIVVTVSYEDVLSNWYKQEVYVEYTTVNVVNPDDCTGLIKYNVKEAEIVSLANNLSEPKGEK